MKHCLNKRTILFVSLALLLAVAVGTTAAYLMADTDPLRNEFEASRVDCAVVENWGLAIEGEVTEIGTIKRNVQIQNTGDTDAYIRAKVIVNWMNEDGTLVWATKPAEDEYVIQWFYESSGWFDGGDGFYYFSEPISAGEPTDFLIRSASLAEGVSAPTFDGVQYYLSIEIVATAIQASPASVVQQQWGVEVANDGTISK